MLVDLKVVKLTQQVIEACAEDGFDARQLLPQREAQGVYVGHLNAENFFEHGQLKGYADFAHIISDESLPWERRLAAMEEAHGFSGVADNVEQVLAYHADKVNDPEKKYVVIYTPIHKADEPERDGWRWHKWGEYIGTQNPQCEYLYDEERIEMVIVFHVYGIQDADVRGLS